MKVKTWEQRINEMDTSKGVSNVMIQEALKQEIYALRAQIYRIREQRNVWKRTAHKYRKILIGKPIPPLSTIVPKNKSTIKSVDYKPKKEDSYLDA